MQSFELEKMDECDIFKKKKKNVWLLHHAPLSWENFLGLCTIYKQTKMHSVCISVMSVLNPFNSGEPHCIWSVCSEHTPEAVGSRHLCFQSQHSYYGFHVACKVLCICFDQSLFGMPSHIKMLGIHLLRTNKPSRVLFLQHDFAVK